MRRPLYEGVDWNITNITRLDNDRVALFTRAWIEIFWHERPAYWFGVALFTRAWIEITLPAKNPVLSSVALFTRAWIEITAEKNKLDKTGVALFTRAWIEITHNRKCVCLYCVALFTRAWIEILVSATVLTAAQSRPLYEGVDWNLPVNYCSAFPVMSPSLRGRGLK